MAYLERLVGLGGDIRVKAADGRSFFMLAASSSNAAVMSYLLDRQFDPNEQAPGTGMTAAHIAVLTNCRACVATLKRHGARMNIPSAAGETVQSLCRYLNNNAACKEAL